MPLHNHRGCSQSLLQHNKKVVPNACCSITVRVVPNICCTIIRGTQILLLHNHLHILRPRIAAPQSQPQGGSQCLPHQNHKGSPNTYGSTSTRVVPSACCSSLISRFLPAFCRILYKKKWWENQDDFITCTMCDLCSKMACMGDNSITQSMHKPHIVHHCTRDEIVQALSPLFCTVCKKKLGRSLGTRLCCSTYTDQGKSATWHSICSGKCKHDCPKSTYKNLPSSPFLLPTFAYAEYAAHCQQANPTWGRREGEGEGRREENC